MSYECMSYKYLQCFPLCHILFPIMLFNFFHCLLLPHAMMAVPLADDNSDSTGTLQMF